MVAVAQLAITVAEPDANRQAAADAVAEAAAAGARLVVLPELCDSGYVFDAADPAAEARGLAAPAADSATLRQWQALAARHRLVIVGGFCELGADGRLYNSAALVDASGTRAVYRKAHLWDNEKLVFTPGDAAPPVVDTEVGRVAVMVCYDLEFPEWTRLAALDGADLIAAPVNWPGYRWPAGERPAEVIKAQAAAAANGVFVAVADRCRDRARRVLDQRLAHRRPGRLPAGRAGARRPARGAHRRLRPAAGQGQERVRAQRPAGRPPSRAVRLGAGQARRGGDRALGGAVRRERHQLPRLPGDHGPHRRAGTTGAANGAVPRGTTSSWPRPPRRPAGRSPRGRPGGGPPCAGTGASSSSPTTRRSSGPRTSARWPASAAARARSARPPSRSACPTRAARWPRTSGSRRRTASSHRDHDSRA